ncbi:MAG: HDOD domain-containing protein [Pirellulaceae bacterium]
MEATPCAPPAPNVNPDSATSILDHLASRAAQLYSLPAVAVKVLELTGSGDVDRAALKACLENDPALTTRILKVVNSSLFGLTRRVTDLGQALVLLGVKPLKMLVLGFSLPDQLVADTEKEVLTQYWRHTLLKAAGCRELCRKAAPADGEEAFTAGLLQDVGELVLIQQLGPSYIRFRSQVRKELRPLREAEFLALGFDHVELSAKLLSQWGMPSAFTELVAAKLGTNRTAQGQAPLVELLHVAELMATVVENDGHDQVGLAATAQEVLGLSADQVQEIVEVLMQRAEELARILSLDLPARADLSTAAHARLSEASVEMLEGASEEALLADMASLQLQMQTAARQAFNHDAGAPRMHAAERPRQLGRQASSGQEHTLLINDPDLLDIVEAAISRCRGEKRSLSLVLIQAHGAPGSGGAPETYPAPEQLLAGLEHWSQDRGNGLILPQNMFALAWEDCNRSDGFELARHILRLGKESSLLEGGLLASGWMLSAGLATLTIPTRNFPPRELIAAANRCLAAALLSGSGTVKSIEF